MIEEPAFAWESSAVAVEGSVGGDDAMARHDDADAVLTIGESDGACAAWIVESGRELPVGDGFSERDINERVPDFGLPLRSGTVEGDRESRELAFEVSVELVLELIEERVIALDHLRIKRGFEFGLLRLSTLGGAHLEQADAAVGGRGTQGAEGGLDDAADQGHAYSITARHTECMPGGALYPVGVISLPCMSRMMNPCWILALDSCSV